VTGGVLLGVLDPLVGAALLAIGALVWRQRSSRVGVLLLLAGVCWFAGALVPGLVTLHRGALVHLLATYPSGRTRGVTTAVVVLGWVLAAAGAVGGPWTTLAVAILLAAIATARLTRAAALRRDHLVPVIVGSLSYAAVLLLAGANVLADLDADLALAVTYDLVVAALAVALGAGLWSAPPTDDTVADVLTGLGSAGDRELVTHLRRVLGDPRLTLGYWSPDRATYVDESGREVEVPADRARTTITQGGSPPAILVHDPALLEDPPLLEGATAAVRVTAANATLRREALDRAERLSQARRRLLEVADVEAQALTHRLEDGPQARLRAASQALAQLDGSDCADPATVAAVRHELELSRHELQELAHGIRPRPLTEGGLALAIPQLAAASRVATDVAVDVGRLDAAVEAALYFFCTEGLANAAKHASASSVRVAVRAEAGAVVAEVTDDGIGGADPHGAGLRGLKDRIEALGGTLEMTSPHGEGTHLVARVPTDRRTTG